MNRQQHDVTEAELALLQSLWDSGPATIRQLVDRVYKQEGTSVYATVQKLLDRLDVVGHSIKPRGFQWQACALTRAEAERPLLRLTAEAVIGIVTARSYVQFRDWFFHVQCFLFTTPFGMQRGYPYA